MAVTDLVPRVRKALGVSSSYDAVEVPALIRSAIGRLLRDYNFPKSVTRAYLGAGPAAADGNPTLELGDSSFDLPAGFKREFQVRFRDPADNSWTKPLSKREGFILPDNTQTTSWYWLEGTKLYIDLEIDTDGVGKQLVLIHQSQLVDATSEDWITTDFPDAVCYLSLVRGAVDFRKPEVAQAYGALWQDEQTSLAIYLNELEWGNTVLVQRELRNPLIERYPSHEL